MVESFKKWIRELFKPKITTMPTNPINLATEPPQPQSRHTTAIDMITTWAIAIAHWEGALPSSNNPGNLKYSTLTASWGATKGRQALDGGFFCQFATPKAGADALYNFLKLGCEGELIISHPQPCTLDQFTTRFAGNPPQGYKDGIAHDLGVPLTTDIKTFL